MNKKELWDYAQTVTDPTVTYHLTDIFCAGVAIEKARTRLKLLCNLAEANEGHGHFYDVEDMVDPAVEYESAVTRRNQAFRALAFTIRNIDPNIQIDFA